MWPPEAALQLRHRGHDVVGVATLPELRGRADEVVLATAQAEGRAVVTESVADYLPLAAARSQAGQAHSGVILTSNRRHPRHDPRTLGRLVTALDDLLSGNLDETNLEHWLP